MTPELNNERAAQLSVSGALPHFASRALALAHRRPLLGAAMVVISMFVFSILVFRPSYDTNDDPAMCFIVSGRASNLAPDEHMVFTHFLVGLVLQRLYVLAPAIPWYGLYLFAVHAAAHIALLYLLFKQRLGPRWFAVYLAYTVVVGLMLLCSLQFTTTAFLAAQSGLLLGLFALARAADGDRLLARRTAIAGVALLTAAALIRWHVFMLFFSLAVPAACVLAWRNRSQKRLLIKAAGLTGLTLAGLVGLALVNSAYYAGDPRWSDFYSYNELRARINDLGWVYYSPETAHVFPKVGWSVNDYAMIQSWFFDDPAVYNAEKLQELLAAHPWQETMPGQGRIVDLLSALAGDPHVVPLLVVLPLVTLLLGRNNAAQMTLLFSCVWICGIIGIATLLRKPPPPRIYLPILSFPITLGVFLAAIMPRFASRNDSASGPDKSPSPRHRKHFASAQLAVRWACIGLAAFGVVQSLGSQYERGKVNSRRSEAFYQELASIARDPEKLYIVWGACVPFELLRPMDNLKWLSNVRMLLWGWPQQCPFYGDMKRQFGINDVARELADRPDIVLVSDQACLRLLIDYIREHHGREARFEQIAPMAGVAMFRASGAAHMATSGAHPTTK
ncbi:MAG TPA: hypothetical protein VJ809_08900 [Pirellulales bacterium]|jgi:hypothetical protein|nr:hypothetical protein [Pirellulales bacterium]